MAQPRRPSGSTSTPTSKQHNYSSFLPRRLLPQQPTAPPRVQSHGPYGRRASPLPRPPDHLGLPGTAPCSCRFCVRMYVCVLLGMAQKDTTPLLVFGRSVVRVSVSFPKFPGTFVFGCRLRRACASGVGKSQITNYRAGEEGGIATFTVLAVIVGP